MRNAKTIARKAAKVAVKETIKVLPTLPGRAGRFEGKLAKDGGLKVRDTRYRPWPVYPDTSLTDWTLKLGPQLMKIFLSGVEGLPQPLANQFAREWAEYCGAKYALLLPHGTDALRVCIAAALNHDGLDYGGEIIVPNLSFIASASTVLDRRCGIALVDVDPRTYTLDPKRVEEAIVSGKTRAIMAVHLFGQPADMTALRGIAKRHSLVLLEDAAQAHGAEHELGRAGGIGDAAGFSFQSWKNLTAGEGGAFTTNDPDIFERAYAFHNVGRARLGGQRWGHNSLGFNLRASEYVAAVLLHRLKKLESQQRTRATNFLLLRSLLTEVPCVEPLEIGPGVIRHGVHMFVMRYHSDQCGGLSIDDFIRAIQLEGIPLSRGYTATMSQQPALERVADEHPDYLRVLPTPVSDEAVKNMLFLPHNVFLGSAEDTKDLAGAFSKVQKQFQPQTVRVRQRPTESTRVPVMSEPTPASSADAIRIGIIGVGVMGREHAQTIRGNQAFQLVGVADALQKNARNTAVELGCKAYASAPELISSGDVNTVVIATPHWQHGELTVKALRAGLNVICEKPLTVTVEQADEVLHAAASSSGMFAVVHQKRFEPAYLYAKRLLDSDELGPIYRCSMIESAWRSDAYYASSPWRGTWKGEGGGVLLNQAPHILDRYAWLCGMPETVTARCDTNLHQIEVEDTASAILRHANGAHGYIHISTIEAPAIAHTVISCDRGRITIDNGKVFVTRLPGSIRERTATETQLMGEIENETREVHLPPAENTLVAFYSDFASAINGEGTLICSGPEERS